MRNHLLALGLLAGVANAEPVVLEELTLQAEYPVTEMPGGNLSGLALCGETLWAVSDRDDDRLYQLHREEGLLRAEAETFVAPPPRERPALGPAHAQLGGRPGTRWRTGFRGNVLRRAG